MLYIFRDTVGEERDAFIVAADSEDDALDVLVAYMNRWCEDYRVYSGDDFVLEESDVKVLLR